MVFAGFEGTNKTARPTLGVSLEVQEAKIRAMATAAGVSSLGGFFVSSQIGGCGSPQRIGQIFVLVAAHRSTLGDLAAGALEQRGEPVLYHLPVRSKEFGPGARYRARGGSGKTCCALIAVRRLKEFVR
jgi:hypothetical protein